MLHFDFRTHTPIKSRLICKFPNYHPFAFLLNSRILSSPDDKMLRELLSRQVSLHSLIASLKRSCLFFIIWLSGFRGPCVSVVLGQWVYLLNKAVGCCILQAEPQEKVFVRSGAGHLHLKRPCPAPRSASLCLCGPGLMLSFPSGARLHLWITHT